MRGKETRPQFGNAQQFPLIYKIKEKPCSLESLTLIVVFCFLTYSALLRGKKMWFKVTLTDRWSTFFVYYRKKSIHLFFSRNSFLSFEKLRDTKQKFQKPMRYWVTLWPRGEHWHFFLSWKCCLRAFKGGTRRFEGLFVFDYFWVLCLGGEGKKTVKGR